ncbi:transporter [Haloferula sp. A504]|uniref:SphA family protein n=1 Tax=Haloferula sp. A504 TaxID=3373601 RepID=UPI0031C81CA5|nr:transporter [Verrucomicrobiaceae bacterium E54]
MKRHPSILPALSVLLLATPCSLAEEGGAGHHVPGGMGTLIDLLPTEPGWVFESMYMRYSGDASATARIPIANRISLGLDATSDAFMLGGFCTFEEQVLGAHYSVGAFVPYVWMDVEALVRIGNLPPAYQGSSESGLGDISLMPVMMAWKSGEWQFNAALPIYAPTGDYRVGRLANPGLNHWSFDPTVGVAYSNEETGFNFAAHTGLTFATENPDTNYRNGTLFHLDLSAQQLLPAGPGFLGIGVEAFYLEQVRDDSGRGAPPGGFKSRSYGLGPVLSYILPVGDDVFVAEARWLAELDTTNRMQGDYFWLKAVYQF